MKAPSKNPRLDDLISIVKQLYPQADVALSRVGKNPTDLRVVPFPRYARMVVPAGVSSAARDALSRPNAGDRRHNAVPREFLSWILSHGLGRALMPYGLTIADEKDSIVEHLGEVLGQSVVISLTVGSARANRKPILNVHSVDGDEIGFAKVGLGTLTDSLVRHEAAVLDVLPAAAAGHFTLPSKIYSGTWQDHEVLLIGALRPDVRQNPHGIPEDAAAAIINSVPLSYVPLAGSQWLAGMRSSLEPLRLTSDSTLPKLLDEFISSFGTVTLPFGAWHGDFGPWNMAHTSTLPMVWDWERYSNGVPAGMDVVHFAAHQELRKIGNMAAARVALEQTVPGPLRQVVSLASDAGLPEPRQVRVITLAYLFTIATRFTLDAQSQDGGSVRPLARWHHQVIADQLYRAVSAWDQKLGIHNDSH